MVEIYALKIDEPIDYELYRRLISCVSEDKQKRIKKYRFIEDAKRSLYGDVLIRHLACNKLRRYNKELVFYHNEFGKPFLRGYPNFNFNISHSGSWVVCAISEKQIGIDVEEIKNIDFYIAKRFFSGYEYSRLMKQPEELRLDYFYILWTLKESYIKYIGKGLSIPLDSWSFIIKGNRISTLPEMFPTIHFQQLFLEQNYKLSFCSEECKFTNKVQEIDISVLRRLTHGG